MNLKGQHIGRPKRGVFVAALAGILLVLMISSAWYEVEVSVETTPKASRYAAYLGLGTVRFGHFSNAYTLRSFGRGFFYKASTRWGRPRIVWCPYWFSKSSGDLAIVIPLWMFLIPPGIGSVLLLSRKRPAQTCHICGYDLTGIETAFCPECGERLRHRQAKP